VLDRGLANGIYPNPSGQSEVKIEIKAVNRLGNWSPDRLHLALAAGALFSLTVVCNTIRTK